MRTVPRHVLGVDAGGTNTRALVLDETGRVLGLGRGGPGNPISSGPERAIASVVTACRAAVDDAVRTSQELATGAVIAPDIAVISMAGGATVGGRVEGLGEALQAAGIDAAPSIASDSLATYFSATTEPDGGVLIAGTGAVAVAVKQGESDSIIDGVGWLIGDDGSGFWIGRRVVHAVAADLDQRGPATSLTAAVMATIPAASHDVVLPGTEHRTALVQAIYAMRPVDLAQYAPLAFEHASSDPVAAQILDDAAGHLTHTVDTLLGRVPAGPIVLGGGVAGSVLGDRLMSHIGERARRAKDGSIGASVLALRGAGVEVTESVRETIAATWAERLNAG